MIDMAVINWAKLHRAPVPTPHGAGGQALESARITG
jgi:hypothetical protein